MGDAHTGWRIKRGYQGREGGSSFQAEGKTACAKEKEGAALQNSHYLTVTKRLLDHETEYGLNSVVMLGVVGQELKVFKEGCGLSEFAFN